VSGTGERRGNIANIKILTLRENASLLEWLPAGAVERVEANP
jgi:hypothetical protein